LLVTTDYRLPITDYRLPITDYRLPITWLLVYLSFASVSSLRSVLVAGCWLTTDYRLPITWLLVTTDYRLPITDYLVAGLPRLRLGELAALGSGCWLLGYRLPITDYRLPITWLLVYLSFASVSSLRSVLVAGCWLPPITDYRLPITWFAGLPRLHLGELAALGSGCWLRVTRCRMPDAGRHFPHTPYPIPHTSFFEI
jgi:hypothetical protein